MVYDLTITANGDFQGFEEVVSIRLMNRKTGSPIKEAGRLGQIPLTEDLMTEIFDEAVKLIDNKLLGNSSTPAEKKRKRRNGNEAGTDQIAISD